jgi:type IV pilus assembly protein PilW
LNATGINELDRMIPLEGYNAQIRALESNRKTYWKKVVAVKVAMLVRGSQAAGSRAAGSQYDLFGELYSNTVGRNDAGTHLSAASFPPATLAWPRKVFSTTVQIRTQVGG